MSDLQCHACGKKFRSMSAEAKHRHNFPAMCTRNRTFERFVAEIEQDKLKERIALLEYHFREVLGTYDEWVDLPSRSLRVRLTQVVARAIVATGLGK